MAALIFHGNRHPISRQFVSGGQPNLFAIHFLRMARDIGRGASK
jgi:hypothetical protein